MDGYNSKSCSSLEKPFYSPIEAALRWCGLIQHEQTILEAMGDMAIPPAGRFPRWPCLRVNAEKIIDAIEHNELPCGRDGQPVQAGEHVARHRRTIRHADLKKWMSSRYPDQTPEFLFDEIERKTHAAINKDSFMALQADLGAAQAEIKNARAWAGRTLAEMESLRKERDALIGERDSLRAIVNRQFNEQAEEAAQQSASGETKERATMQKIIYSMAISAPYNYNPRAVRQDAAAIIASATAAAGFPISDDTVRNHLKAAAKDIGAT